MLRYYKPVPDRFRPTDRMVAHTGYLIFSRPVLLTQGRPEELEEETGRVEEDLESDQEVE
jgi:tRNA (adenine57-N1/adenine58-N1)-methyltransferase